MDGTNSVDATVEGDTLLVWREDGDRATAVEVSDGVVRTRFLRRTAEGSFVAVVDSTIESPDDGLAEVAPFEVRLPSTPPPAALALPLRPQLGEAA